MRASNVLETIGNTPHIRVNRLFGPGANVWIKSERTNPGGSIKDRIALSMIEDAEASGKLRKGGTIIEPTSGNTGIGLAMVAAVKGYPLVLVMPDSMSVERRRLILEGDPPSPINPPHGCRFHTRCHKRFERCDKEEPVLREVAPGHWVSCHLY